jgi:Down syndrome cell adhesion molecule-like protein 1
MMVRLMVKILNLLMMLNIKCLDPANCAPEEDQYGSQYGGPYGTPYDHYDSRGSIGRRSQGSIKNSSPEPPPP